MKTKDIQPGAEYLVQPTMTVQQNSRPANFRHRAKRMTCVAVHDTEQHGERYSRYAEKNRVVEVRDEEDRIYHLAARRIICTYADFEADLTRATEEADRCAAERIKKIATGRVLEARLMDVQRRLGLVEHNPYTNEDYGKLVDYKVHDDGSIGYRLSQIGAEDLAALLEDYAQLKGV